MGEPSRRGGVLPASMFVVLIGALVQAWLSDAPTGAGITLVVGLSLCGVSLIVRGALLEHRMRALLSGERRARLDIVDREAELARLNERLAEDSRRDALTGLRNRRALSDDLAALEATARGGDHSAAFALCDIDHFKAYNDHLGHLAGDQALRAIASTIRATLGAGDIGYRFGGEELLLVLRETTAEEAIGAAERIRAAVADIALPHPAGTDGILTISIGVAPGPGKPESCSQMRMPPCTKPTGGRNRVVVTSAELGAKTIARRPLDRSAEPVPGTCKACCGSPRRRGEPWPDPCARGARRHDPLRVLVHHRRGEPARSTTSPAPRGGGPRRRRSAANAARQRQLLGGVGTVDELRARPLRHRLATCRLIRLARTRTDMDATDRGGARPDSWHPDDMLLLPLRGFTGEILGVVSVDEPLNGQRPHEAELTILMAVADHAGLALERALDDGAHKSRTGRPDPAHEILTSAA